MTSTYPLLEEQFSGVAGTYLTDLALIRLGKDESYWSDQNKPTLDRLAVFIHEYAHYLHNFSTFSGLQGFVTSLRRFRLFVNTVDASGRSQGSGVLKPEDLAEYRGAMQLRKHLAGALGMSHTFRSASRGSFRIVDWKFDAQHALLASQALKLLRVSVQVRAGSPEATIEESFALGSHVLSESLAWEMERILFETQGADLSTLERVAAWPYKFARRFLEHATQSAVASEVVAKIALLALQSTDPGVSFVELAGTLRDRGARSPEEVVETARLQFHTFAIAKQEAIAVALRKEVEPFASRVPLRRSFTTMVESAIQLVSVRVQHPFFEIDVMQDKGGGGLVEMIKSFPPCPIIHATAWGEEIFYISDAEPQAADSISLGVTQAAMQFAAQHYRDAVIISTDQVSPFRCRFFGSCSAPQTKEAPVRCTQRPWESFDAAGGEQCWYGHGVSMTRGFTPPKVEATTPE